MSEEAFSNQCSEVYNSNLFGEDLSQLVCHISKSGGDVHNLISKANEASINSCQFFTSNKEWLMHEVS